MIDRRTFVSALAGGLVAAPLLVRAQQATKTHRLGFLRIDRPPQAYIDAFEQGLRDRGYTPGKNILLEYRFGDGKSADLPRLAGELVMSSNLVGCSMSRLAALVHFGAPAPS